MSLGPDIALRTEDFYYDERYDYYRDKEWPASTGAINMLAQYRIFDSGYIAIAAISGFVVGFFDLALTSSWPVGMRRQVQIPLDSHFGLKYSGVASAKEAVFARRRPPKLLFSP